jgi:hypothetical protein
LRAQAAEGQAYGTIGRRVATVAKMHRAGRLDGSTKAEEGRNALKATGRALGVAANERPWRSYSASSGGSAFVADHAGLIQPAE